MERIDSNVIVGINPNYCMRRDGGVGTLCEGGRVFEEIPHREGFLTHIHLLTAILFACFDGRRTLREAAQQASERLGVPFDACVDCASLYINNSEVVSNRIGSATQTVPQYMLVPVRDGLTFRSYDPDVFTSEAYDFTPPERLGVPVNLNVVLTTKCLTDCVYCYARRPIPNHPAFGYEAVLDLIEQAAEKGVAKVDINGGEVLLYPQWFDVVKALVAHGYSPLISTKIPIKEDVAEKIIDLGMPRFQISMDTVDYEASSALLRVQGNRYIRDMSNALGMLSNAGVHVQINSLITNKNSSIQSMDALVEFLSEHTCVKQISFSPAGYSLYRKSFSAYAAARSAIDTLSVHLNGEVKSRYPQIRFTFSEGEHSLENRSSSRRFASRAFCTANTRSAVVLPDGRVTICEELYDNPTFIIGDLKEKSLLEVWNSQKALDLFYLKRGNIPSDSPCRTCNDFDACRRERGVCWKTVLMAYGEDNCFFPDPLCPKAPKPINTYWHIN